MKHILLVDDDSRDVELTLAAMEEHHLANLVTVAKNGEVDLDSLFEPDRVRISSPFFRAKRNRGRGRVRGDCD